MRLSESLDKFAKKFGSSSASAMAGLFSRWEELVGASIAAHAKPVSLRGGRLSVGQPAGQLLGHPGEQAWGQVHPEHPGATGSHVTPAAAK